MYFLINTCMKDVRHKIKLRGFPSFSLQFNKRIWDINFSISHWGKWFGISNKKIIYFSTIKTPKWKLYEKTVRKPSPKQPTTTKWGNRENETARDRGKKRKYFRKEILRELGQFIFVHVNGILILNQIVRYNFQNSID